MGDSARGLKSFTSVLIVACPCALALAAPFALGTAQRLLARIQVFLKNAVILERLAEVDTIVFDKTGTLTSRGMGTATFQPFRGALTDAEREWVWSVARHSTHPQSVQIAGALSGATALAPGGKGKGDGNPSSANVNSGSATAPAGAYLEVPGRGIEGRVDGHQIQLGSRAWLEECGLKVPARALPPGNVAYLAIDRVVRGAFVMATSLRPNTGPLLRELGNGYELALLSGDNEREKHLFRELFGAEARLCFNQSPLEKLSYIRKLQDTGRTVMMVGDGLNDAGALQQSEVGVAVVDEIGTFSPASDVIIEASRVPELSKILALSRGSTRVVRLSFALSACYNLAGVSVAAAGILSPVICAVLMPLSSVSVALFACGAVNYTARKLGIGPPDRMSRVS